MESDRIILLANDGDTVDDLTNQLTDDTGMFSLTDIHPVDQDQGTNADQDADQETPNGDHEPSAMVYIAAVVASIGGLLFGYDIGVISGAKIQIQSELGLSCGQVESIVAMLPFGAFVASLIGGNRLRERKHFYLLRI
jgi:hypothetical protein